MRSLLTIWLLILAHSSSATLIVAGQGQRVSTLQQAVALAKDGDSILLKKGLYTEGNILVRKAITLLGEPGAILDGQKKTELLTLSGSHITVKGLVLRNAGYSALNDYAAIKVVDAHQVTIEQCTVENAYFALHISNTTRATIRNNKIIGSPASEQLTGNGIHLWKCSGAVIEKNYVTGHRDGIYFEFVTGSTIRNNTSERNLRYGLHFMFSHNDHYTNNTFRKNGAGVAVMYSKKVTMEGNHFEENWGASAYGILLKELTDGRIEHNTFHRNTVGIYMEGSSRMEVRRNSFRNNGWALKVQASCDDNNFLQNNFTGNTFDVATNGTMMLNTFSGNYWDKYEGYDLNKDGIGDVPYFPVSVYSMVVEQNPTTLILLRSFIVSLLDKAEKAIPVITPANLVDNQPLIKPIAL
ncbi:MAG: nitrous oxide reductase family maturation protein NosD [Candidatus Pseudobacter hemicellulosilyticus]|uniref:Nitrous oxide reductase family maturation protein NosD n=1 Tax=Candidatus Pseudobacter hemicellulosilyticus TaxID=3121375 RepID=A0AAJ5WSZ4_9BACT|nr:MAG: nitrous oxide reductase family maturation protein NosD [Pseudobacter sp.]